MKRLILLLVLLPLLAAEAQTPCTYVKNEVDPFDGKTVIITSSQLLHNWYDRISISFARIDHVSFMMIDIDVNTSACFRNGTSIIFLDDAGQTFEIQADPSGGSIDCGKILTGGRRLFQFIAELDHDLIGFNPTAMRLDANKGYLTFRQFRGQRTMPFIDIMQMAYCIE